MRTFRVPWRASRRQLVENSVADMTDAVDLKKELPRCCSPALAPLCLSAGLRSASRTDHSVIGSEAPLPKVFSIS